MDFRRFVEIGRVALVNYGPHCGKLVVIVDVLDQNRALVEGPGTGVDRQLMPYARMELTDFKLNLQRNARPGKLKKAFDEAQIVDKFAQTAWGKKLARRKRRAQLTDFERYKVRFLRKRKALVIHRKMHELRKSAA